MKQLLLILALAFTLPVVTQTGCNIAPSGRVVAVQTLKATGQIAEEAVATSARLFRDGHITGAQARQVIDVYNLQFQPAFRLAVTAAKSDLSSIASPDLVTLASQLATLVSSFVKPKPI